MINLYHYTSVDGFEGIVKNNSIRMTKSEFLNDLCGDNKRDGL